MCGAARTRFRSVAWGERMFRAARARTGLAVAVLVLAIAGLTALVAGGALTRIDQYGLDHLMPALNPDRAQAQESHGYRGYFLPFGLNTSWWVKLLDTWCYPCSVVISFLIVALACLVLHRRGRTVLGLAWAGAWVAGNAIEVIGKGVLARPDLFGTDDAGLRIHVSVFDQSFPSGHAIRCVLVAGALLLLLQRHVPRGARLGGARLSRARAVGRARDHRCGRRRPDRAARRVAGARGRRPAGCAIMAAWTR